MTKINVSRTIAAPVDRVFDTTTDLRRAADRIQGIERIDVLTDGPVGKGTRFRETRKMYGKQATEEMEITEFEPPRRYAVGCENHGCRYLSEFRFEPDGDGTRVEMTFQAVPLTTFAKAMGFLMKPMAKSVARICAKDLDDLKAAIEDGSGADDA